MNNNCNNKNAKLGSVTTDFFKNCYGSSIAVFLDNGVKLQGVLVAYDKQSITLQCVRDKSKMLVMIWCITTISDRQVNDNKDKGVFSAHNEY